MRLSIRADDLRKKPCTHSSAKILRAASHTVPYRLACPRRRGVNCIRFLMTSWGWVKSVAKPPPMAPITKLMPIIIALFVPFGLGGAAVQSGAQPW